MVELLDRQKQLVMANDFAHLSGVGEWTLILSTVVTLGHPQLTVISWNKTAVKATDLICKSLSFLFLLILDVAQEG